MKKAILAAAAIGAMTLAGAAVAQESDYLGLTPRVEAEAKAMPAAVPAGVQLVELERWIWNDNMYSVRPLPGTGNPTYHSGQRQGVLGFISFTPFEGGRPLFQCVNGRDFFTSTDENCEGYPKRDFMPITGYIATTQLPGTVPLYRCMRGGLKPNNWADHFDTLDFNCENVRFPVNEGPIGYIWL